MSGRIYPKSHPLCVDSIALHAPQFNGDAPESFQEPISHVRRRVKQAVSKGDFLRAIALLNRLIMDYPASAEDHNNRGLIHFWNGSSYRAVSDFNRAIALNPELPAAYNNRGNYYVAQGHLERALEDYDRAIDLDPFHVRARINHAMTLRDLNRYDEALIGFEDALLFRQFDSEIYAERGRTYHLRGDWNCAIADYHRALEAISNCAESLATIDMSRRRQIMAWLHEFYPAA